MRPTTALEMETIWVGSVLAHARGEPTIDEAQLTAWTNVHLKVLAVPFDDADTLGQLEEDVLRRLDPPLNLKGMAVRNVGRAKEASIRHSQHRLGSVSNCSRCCLRSGLLRQVWVTLRGADDQSMEAWN